MDAGQWIEERQSPEPDQRESVAPDGTLHEDRDEVVHQAPSDRGDEQADQIVDEHAGNGAAARPGNKVLRQEVAHGVGQEGPDQGRHEVP